MSQAGIINTSAGPVPPTVPTSFVTNSGIAIPAANILNVLGSTVVAGSIPFQTIGSGNTVTGQIQISQAIAASDATKIGLAAFNSAQFTVDANGFVSLFGSSSAITSIGVDTFTAPGTNPVVPTAGGLITITGAQVASGTIGVNVIRTDSLSANAFKIEIQRSTAVGAPVLADNGVCHFDSARFTVSVDGFVSASGTGLGQTITGDSGGALSPTSGNWNILGLSGSKTSGSGSTLTIKSPPYSDQGGSTTVTLNSGSFATAAITLTLPASAGLSDGDLFEFVCTTAGALVIQAVGAQKIRLSSSLSSAAGTLTSTAIGDSITLRFRAADGFFYATSSIGNWTVG
jgi:hypothetical protein